MKYYCLYATDFPEAVRRKFIHNVFDPFGKIKKIYIPLDETFASIFFETQESVEAALSIHQQPPHYLSLSLTLNNSAPRNDNSVREHNNTANSDTNSVNSMSTMDYEDIYGDNGPDLFNIHGIRVPTLTADDGKLYVELGQVEKLGFALFPEQQVPNISFDKQMITEFEMYMKVKARNYIRKIGYDMPEKVVQDIKDKVVKKYVNNRPSSSSTTNTPTPSSRSNQFNNTPYQNGNSETTPRNSQISFRDRYETQNEQQRPLRKPNQPNNDYRASRGMSNTKGTYNESRATHNEYKRGSNEHRPAHNEQRPAQNDHRRANNEYKGPPRTRSKSTAGRLNNVQPIEQEDTASKPQDVVPTLREVLTSVKHILLTLNQPTKVVVSFVVSPTKCWVYPDNKKDELQELLYNVNREAMKKSVCEPVLGQIYAATYCGGWYRAIVVETKPAVKVQFIDFGNFNDEEVKEVLALPDILTTQPGLAMCLNFLQQPSTQLEDGVELDIKVLKKNIDNSYEVEEIVKDMEPPKPMTTESPKPMTTESPKLMTMESPKPMTTESPKLMTTESPKLITPESPKPMTTEPPKPLTRESPKQLMNLNVVPAGQMVKSTTSQSDTKTKPIKSPIEFKRNVTFNPSTSKAPETAVETLKNPPQQTSFKEKLANMPNKEKIVNNAPSNPERKSVVDVMGKDIGILQFIKKYDAMKCLCAVMPQSFFDVVSALDEISAESNSEYVGKVGETVCVEKDDNTCFARGTIIDIKADTYTVALIDYGTILTTKNVAKLEMKYMDIPEFTAVCTGKPECISLIEKGQDDSSFVGEDKNVIKVEFDGIFYKVTCVRWNPFETEKINEAPQPEAPIFTTRPITKELKSDEQVKLVILSDGNLLVRNRETYSIFQKVLNEIAQYNATPLTQKLIPKQVILCSHESITGLCRGVTQSVNNHSAEIEYIDYGFVDTVPLKDIKNINESLANEACSLIPIALKDFENDQYTDEYIKAIGEYCNGRKRFVAVKCSGNTFDLKTTDTKKSLTDLLKNKGDRVTYKDIQKRELNLGGIENLICVSVEDIKSMVFIQNDDTTHDFYKLSDQISDYVEKDNKPYTPIVDELCLASYDDEWYRGKVVKENKAINEYEIYYIDYGNSATVPPSKIRRISKEFIKVPGQALHCCLTEILNSTNDINDDITNLIKDNIIIGNSYELKILGKLDDQYEIKLQSLSRELLNKLDF